MPRHPWRMVPGTQQKQLHRYSTVTRRTFDLHTRGAVVLIGPALRTGRVLQTSSSIPACLHPRLRYDPGSFRVMSTLESKPVSEMRKNKVDIQMLHPELHKKVFPESQASSAVDTRATQSFEPTPEMVKYAIAHLEKQDLWGKEAIPAPHTSFPVPELRGKNIEDHFFNLGNHYSNNYKKLATTFAQSPAHPPPEEWHMRAGWTRYGKDGSVEQVDYPREQMMAFDVETVPALSKYPVMACAISPESWYGWVSPWLIDPVTKDGHQNDQHLLSFGPSGKGIGNEKILVGHNVGYDRARVLEEYTMELNGIRYLDTMSLHIAASGLCTQQRPNWLKYSKAIEAEDSAYVDAFKDTTGKYFDVSAVNSLLQVAKFHCGIKMDKAPRNILMEATDINLVKDHFQDLMIYCGQDVVATLAVYQKTFPKYMATCPHPVSFAGMLQMGSSFLTVNEGWTAYVTRCNKMYQEMAENVESKLFLLAENALQNFEKDPTFFESDPWLSQLDWTQPKKVWKEGVPLVKGNGFRKGQEPRFLIRTKLLPDKPEWYRALWDSQLKRIKLSTRQRVAPLLLKLQWRGYPLVHSALHGWTFRVPRDDQDFVTKASELIFPTEDEGGCQANIDPLNFRYYRLPHKSGDGVNVGNPLAKGYISYFEDNVLSSFTAEGASPQNGNGELARQALDMNAQCAYWVSAKERIENQFVVWDKGIGGLGDRMGIPERGEGQLNGMILPQIITMGTVTRRAVEKTWMTASNAKKNRIGSELKSMVQAPAGYRIVGADVDSEELWISSLMGDAQFRMHGATALGWMTLQGTKSAGTDLHSKTAQILGISRDQAKIFNYGRIYGAGLKFAARLLQQFNSAIDATEAKQRANNLYTATKGTKQLKPRDYGLVHDRPFWHGGTESYMFNGLERTATAEDPRTPALGCGITDALKPKHTESQFMTSRVNWVVQSSGVDYLHMLLVSMNYLIKKYDINARFMLCVHDEVRYIVKEEDTARATLALQISNLWTRALFSYKLGIHDLPQSVAFFSSVDVDHVFRKEVNMDCITPTQATPIPHGQSLTIEGVLDLTNGGELGQVAKDFCEAAEDSFPMSFRTLKEQRKAQTAEPGSILEASLESSNRDTEQEQLMFLEAQALSSLKEIQKALKRREAEAAAAWKTKQKAEKAAASAGAASRGSDGKDGSNGKDGQSPRAGSVIKKEAKQSSKPRAVREAKVTVSKSRKPLGLWGIVDEEVARVSEKKEPKTPSPSRAQMSVEATDTTVFPESLTTDEPDSDDEDFSSFPIESGSVGEDSELDFCSHFTKEQVNVNVFLTQPVQYEYETSFSASNWPWSSTIRDPASIANFRTQTLWGPKLQRGSPLLYTRNGADGAIRPYSKESGWSTTEITSEADATRNDPSSS
ncbi:DNA-directed DNA polymerase gamma mip1 [Mortierella polycephala]|uniref:DNA-directed DNA polymerase n=1 Tax=Mortierella polycephala TaxID=41804 RepID=A0A9P6Q0F1_9FUNG|nr:DNA-directed DNA polymerase gamma mip1 [Mortierella polycephala]